MNPQKNYSVSYKVFVLAICWLAGAFAGMDGNLFSVMLHSVISDVSMQPSQTEIIRQGSYVLSSFLMGWMLGGIGMGIASDCFGRVKMLACSIILYACFTGISAYAQSVPGLAIYRFFTGIGVGGTMVGISIFLSETWNSSSRAAAIGLLIASYQAGVLLSGTVAQLFPLWRTAFAIGAFPAAISFLILGYFKEPIFSTKSALAEEEPLNRKHLLIGGLIFGSLLVGYWASLSWIPTWMQGLLGSQGTGHEKNFATIVHGICAIAGCLLAGPLADYFGRRLMIAASYTGALAISLWMFLAHASFTPFLFVYFGMLGLCIGMAQAVMYIYLPELFAARVRGTCVGLCLNIGRLVTSAAILFMGVIVNLFGGYVGALSFFSAIYLVGAALAFLAPETNELQHSGIEA